MSIRILKIPSVSAPKGVASRLYDNRSRLRCLLHYGIDFEFRRNVVSNAEPGCASAAGLQPGIVSETRSRPKREFQTGLKIEERYRPVLELRADNTIGLESKPVTVEPDRLFEVVDAESNERYAGLHGRRMLSEARRERQESQRSQHTGPRHLNVLKSWTAEYPEFPSGRGMTFGIGNTAK
jgi:hypothetical protein